MINHSILSWSHFLDTSFETFISCQRWYTLKRGFRKIIVYYSFPTIYYHVQQYWRFFYICDTPRLRFIMKWKRCTIKLELQHSDHFLKFKSQHLLNDFSCHCAQPRPSDNREQFPHFHRLLQPELFSLVDRVLVGIHSKKRAQRHFLRILHRSRKRLQPTEYTLKAPWEQISWRNYFWCYEQRPSEA